MNEGFIEDNLIILTKQTYEMLLKCDKASDCIALYTFYYYTSKWQKSNVVKCTTQYVAVGLNWTDDRVRKAKQCLIEIGLISDKQQRDNNNHIIGHYIQLLYKFKSHPTENPEGGKTQRVENQETNAYSDNNINAYSVNKEYEDNSVFSKENTTLSSTTVATSVPSAVFLDAYKEKTKIVSSASGVATKLVDERNNKNHMCAENEQLFILPQREKKVKRKKQPPVSDNPPTVEDVQAYLDEKGITDINAEEFVAKNESLGWCAKNSQPYYSWKGVVKTWEVFRKKNTQQNISRQTIIHNIEPAKEEAQATLVSEKEGIEELW